MEALRRRVLGRTPVIGTFVKTPSHQTVESLAGAGLDFIAIDAEHAAFGPAELDALLFASTALGLPALVRAPNAAPSFIGACLDLGAVGMLIAHVRDAESARAIVAAGKYAGYRSYSPATRGARFWAARGQGALAGSDAHTSMWCQIEDAEALEQVDAIAAVADVDCLFVGPTDLSLSLGVDGPRHPRVIEAVADVARAARAAGKAAGIFVADTGEIGSLLALGVSVFLCGSDQSLLTAQGRRLRAELDQLTPSAK